MVYLVKASSDLCQSNSEPFHPGRFVSIEDAWSQSINEDYWRHGLIISQGNGMNVSADRCRERLKFIASRLLRAIYGNKYKRLGHKVQFIVVAEEGWKKSHNTHQYHLHHHILMSVTGDHGWNDFDIRSAILKIDELFLKTHGWDWEKRIQVDCNWKKTNRYHSYSTDTIQRGGQDDWNVYVFSF